MLWLTETWLLNIAGTGENQTLLCQNEVEVQYIGYICKK